MVSYLKPHVRQSEYTQAVQLVILLAPCRCVHGIHVKQIEVVLWKSVSTLSFVLERSYVNIYTPHNAIGRMCSQILSEMWEMYKETLVCRNGVFVVCVHVCQVIGTYVVRRVISITTSIRKKGLPCVMTTYDNYSDASSRVPVIAYIWNWIFKGSFYKYCNFLLLKFYKIKLEDYGITNLLGYQVKPLSKIIADQVKL